MKILQIIPRLDLGGGETMCEALCNELMKSGNEVKVVSLYHDETVICERLKKRGICVEYANKVKGFDLDVIRTIKKIIKDFKPDIIHTHLFALKYAILATLFQNIKIVHTIHNIAKKETSWKDRRFNGLFYKIGKVYPVALSEEIKKTIVDEYGIKKVPIVVNGIDLSQCIAKTSYGISESIKIISIGRLSAQKNFGRLIRAFARFSKDNPNSELTIIGDGELMGELRNLSIELSVGKKILFLGLKDNVYPFLRDADIFCLSSDYEGLPMVLIEAMGTGLPIVSTNVGGVSDLINDGYNGFLCSCSDDDLCEKLRIVAGSLETRKKIGKAALKTVERFSSGMMAKSYYSIYESLVKS